MSELEELTEAVMGESNMLQMLANIANHGSLGLCLNGPVLNATVFFLLTNCSRTEP